MLLPILRTELMRPASTRAVTRLPLPDELADEHLAGLPAEHRPRPRPHLAAVADQWFVRYVEGSTALVTDDMSSLDGSTFEGFTLGGNWVVGPQCLSCVGLPPQVLALVGVLAP